MTCKALPALAGLIAFAACATAQQPPAERQPPQPQAQQRPPLPSQQCALLVVSTGLAKYGAAEFGALYEFGQKAGAVLPRQQLADCYDEIACLGDDHGTPADIAAALARLADKHQAVDLILHTHGRPFEMVCIDGPTDVVELAIAANGALAARAAAARQRPGTDVALRLRSKELLAAEGGGGFGLCTSPRAVAACRFRLVPVTGELRDGARVQVATRTGHWLRLGDEGVRADGTPETAAVFTLRSGGGAVQDGAVLRFELDGRGLADGKGGLGEAAAFTAKLLPGPAALALPALSAAQTGHLRAVLTTACFGATEAPALLNLGFHVAAGSRGVSADSATSFPTFLHYWKRGYSFGEAVQAANRSDAFGAQDKIAAQHFKGVDSQRLVLGDADLDREAAPAGGR